MTTATATITYRKTKAGEWVAYGPAAGVRLGPVTVTKRDGTTKAETIERIGRPFTVDGREMVYGYLRTATVQASGRPCDECGRGGASVRCTDSSGIWGTCCRSCASGPSFTRSFA